jgi:glutaminyl-peptide cyclotransferase
MAIVLINYFKPIDFYHGAPVYTYKIVKEYPHDRSSYTQGLVYLNGLLYEGTGRTPQRRSMLGKVQLETGKVLQKIELPVKYFGEGIAIFEQKVYQLTHHAGIGFIYNKITLELLDTFDYTTEGWGLTHDHKHLIMSDGSSSLYFLDPRSLKKEKQIKVYDSNGFVERLNELEYINGKIYANIVATNWIAIINPDSGKVTGWINLNGILCFFYHFREVNVLNGIAYDSDNDRLFVTGKLYPKLFEIKLVSYQDNKVEYIMRVISDDCKMMVHNTIDFAVGKLNGLIRLYARLKHR